MITCSQTGMLSSGVLPPESMFIGSTTRMNSRPNCGMERRDGAEQDAERGDEEQVERRRRPGTAGREPAIGTPSSRCTTSNSDSPAATMMTSPFAQILASMISNGDTGITSRCSIVPCSRSRITAAPVRMHGQHGDVVDDLHHAGEPGGLAGSG